MACPLSGLQTQTLRSRQSYSPTCGYLPLNLSVQNLVLTRGPSAGGSSRLRKPNMRQGPNGASSYDFACGAAVARMVAEMVDGTRFDCCPSPASPKVPTTGVEHTSLFRRETPGIVRGRHGIRHTQNAFCPRPTP